MGWVANTTPRPLYPRERPGTNSIGGWVGQRAGLDGLFNNVRTLMRSLSSLFIADISQKVHGIAFCEIITEISLH